MSLLCSTPGESVSTGDRNETCRVYSIRRCRLEMLVANLVPAFLGGDPAYLSTFLGTYRAFGSPPAGAGPSVHEVSTSPPPLGTRENLATFQL